MTITPHYVLYRLKRLKKIKEYDQLQESTSKALGRILRLTPCALELPHCNKGLMLVQRFITLAVKPFSYTIDILLYLSIIHSLGLNPFSGL
jgi:hypothetical protein